MKPTNSVDSLSRYSREEEPELHRAVAKLTDLGMVEKLEESGADAKGL